jgi:Helix-turn-helix of DDE superfamily endonuclease
MTLQGSAMERYAKLKEYTPKQFRRLSGVRRETFEKMVQILKDAQNKRYKGSGRKGALELEDKLLMALEYLREYRTYFHLGSSYGLSESACYRACKWVEDTLIKSGQFSLPGKKALLKSDMEYEVILVDAAETPVERPKKKLERRKE